jgi:hypothetical protein
MLPKQRAEKSHGGRELGEEPVLPPPSIAVGLNPARGMPIFAERAEHGVKKGNSNEIMLDK